jgi:hypothetical protein
VGLSYPSPFAYANGILLFLNFSDKVKQEMEEKGANMTDGQPLVKIKQAHQKLKKEIVAMDIRLGVLDHMLIVKKLREKRDLQKLTNGSEAGKDMADALV